ncbi:MAG: hypothetical protein HUU28_04980 [Planctomycetaceae bacterium]|nr:hypothetical protein [Planctomycetaceae bacterium]
MRLVLAALAFLSLVTPPALAQTPCHAENDGPNFTDGVSVSAVYFAFQFTAPASFTATGLEVFTGETNATQSLGLWSHNAATNRPLAALSSGSMSVTSTNQWYGAQLAGNVSLTGGQTYWFVWNAVGGGQAPVDVPMATLGQPYCASTNGGATWGNLFQFNDRHWKFRIYGSCTSAPTGYCTAGTTTNGCNAEISASANPSLSGATACLITIDDVEGQKSGIVFYGLGALPQAWCSSGGSSFLCVKAPTARSSAALSGGTSGACDGSLSLDWNAYQSANPGSLGSPFTVGQKVYVQGWFRDPPACKSTSLSNALEMTYVP